MYRCSDRQLAALANMERMIGARGNRTEFTDRAAFDDYWQQCSAQCDRLKAKRQRQQQRATPESAQQQRLRQEQRKQTHYRQADRLEAYARNYIKRYRPSRQRCLETLIKKCGDETISQQVLNRVAVLLDDRGRLRELTKMYQQRGRNRRYIQQHLRQRGFTTEDIKQAIEDLAQQTTENTEAESIANHTTHGESILQRHSLAGTIRQLQNRGWSQAAIRRRLAEHPDDNHIITEALNDYAQDDHHQLRRQAERLHNQGIDEQKLIQRLQRKGYRYADIKQALEEIIEQSTEE